MYEEMKIVVIQMFCILFGLIVAKLLRLIFNSERQFIQVFKDKDQKKKELRLLYALKQFKKKMILYCIFLIALNVLYTYFLFIFCNIFKETQKAWLISSVVSIIYNIILEIVLCLICAIFRYIALRKDVS